MIHKRYWNILSQKSKKNNRLLESKKIYEELINDYPDSKYIVDLKKRILLLFATNWAQDCEYDCMEIISIQPSPYSISVTFTECPVIDNQNWIYTACAQEYYGGGYYCNSSPNTTVVISGLYPETEYEITIIGESENCSLEGGTGEISIECYPSGPVWGLNIEAAMEV